MKQAAFILLIISLMAASCNTPAAIAKACAKCGKTTATAITKDSTSVADSLVKRIEQIIIQADSSSAIYKARCDSNGRVLLALLHQARGTHAQAPVVDTLWREHTQFIRASCVVDSFAVAHIYFERHRAAFTLKRDSIVVVQPLYIDMPLGWWQQFKINYGGFAFAIIAAFAAFKIAVWALKTYAKIQIPWL